MANDNKRINYHKLFTTLRNNDKKVIGKVKKNEIRVSDKSIIDEILFALKSDAFILGKIKYTVIDDYTGDVLALVDVNNRIFDSEGKYIGELKNKNTLLLIILILFLFLLSTVLVVTNIQSAGPVYRDLYVKDEDGVILNENWNIFGNTPNNKVIYPGKSCYYKFNLINDNNVEIKFSIEFTDNNINHIPIVYRLYTNNESLLGDDKWYSIEDINLYDIVIKSNSEFPITLEWKWIDDGKHDFEDTIVGNLDNAVYKINILITSTVI